MKRILLLATAVFLGLFAGEYLTTNLGFRAWCGRLVRRDDLIALVDRRGVYRKSGHSIADTKLSFAAEKQFVSDVTIDGEMNSLRWQFSDEKTWRATLERAGIGSVELRREVTENLRARALLEVKLAAQNSPNEKEERDFYDTHPDQFQEPQRFRASHLFLAAPEGYPDDIIEGKRTLCDALDTRLRNGESFSDLIAEYSEDENSKAHEGDLNYFTKARMLPAIWDAAQTLPEGKTSEPIRSRLGFHLLLLTNNLAPRQLTFEQAAPEIAHTLANEQHAAAVTMLVAQLPGKIQFATPRN